MSKSCITCAFYKPFDVPAVNESYGIWGKCLYGVPEGGTGYNVYIPHGCCNAILLPSVIQYNSRACMERYAQIARAIGLPGSTDKQLTDSRSRRAS